MEITLTKETANAEANPLDETQIILEGTVNDIFAVLAVDIDQFMLISDALERGRTTVKANDDQILTLGDSK